MSTLGRIRDVIMGKINRGLGVLENPIEQIDYAYEKLKAEKSNVDIAVRDCITALKLTEKESRTLEKQIRNRHAQSLTARKVILKLKTKVHDDGEEDDLDIQQIAFLERVLKNGLMEETRNKNRKEQIENSITQMQKTVADLKLKEDDLSLKMQQFKDKRTELKSNYRVAEASEKINNALTGIDSGFGDVDSIIERMNEKIETKVANAEAAIEMHTILKEPINELIETTIDVDIPEKISELDKEIRTENSLLKNRK